MNDNLYSIYLYFISGSQAIKLEQGNNLWTALSEFNSAVGIALEGHLGIVSVELREDLTGSVLKSSTIKCLDRRGNKYEEEKVTT